MTNIEPKFELLALSTNDCPGNRQRVLDARNSAGDLLHFVGHGDGPLERRRVGQLDVDDQVALVLLGNESDRHLRQPQVGQAHQPQVHDQHDRA